MTNQILAPSGIALAVMLASCSVPGVKELARPLAETPFVAAILYPDKLTPDARAYLTEEGLLRVYREDPSAAVLELRQRLGDRPSLTRRLALAELCSKRGDELMATEPGEALGYFLSAAELAWEDAPHSPQPAGALESLRIVYNHACGQLARAWFDSGNDWNMVHAIHGPLRDYRLRLRKGGETLVDPAQYDSLVPASYLEFKDVDFVRHVQKGVGSALVAHRERTPERLREDPFLSPIGRSLALTAVLQFSTSGEDVELSLYDTLEEDSVRLNGREYPMEADFSAPLAALYNYRPKHNVGWLGMLNPEAYKDRMGLFTVEPYRKDQIPVVFVHGLMSDPTTWLTALNELRVDPKLRARYQLLAFYYPTGFPIVYNANSLRTRLREFQEHYDPGRRNPNMRNMILVGHSMGGLLSSLQIRDSGDELERKLFTRPLEEIDGFSAEQKNAITELVRFDFNPDVRRAVFVATPHRGSNVAASPIGKLGSDLIKFSMDLITIQPLRYVDGMTDLGRYVSTHRPTSVWALRPHAPFLEAILELPVGNGIRFHSIIGNKDPGTPVEESGDGVVPYWSSHLEGAASEKVVPATHVSITNQPDAIEEVRRLLYLHAGLVYQPPSPAGVEAARPDIQR